ncbi:MAG: pyridoxamine 5'-phosphate oxidase [Planctomycetota bacterium]|nr:pyridoxamine 5'-phosphate oxidase [Planctomycetota bacterium]MDA1106117.1 pyridoxamine 5'-phosphate oxidase [Planctomycetota bacterium]
MDLLAQAISLLGGPGLPEPLPASPFPLLIEWFEDAKREKRVPNPDSMALATVSPDGAPRVRIVLCKSIDADAGAIVFYTNRHGAKGRELEANPRAAAVFHFDHPGHQARVEGAVERVSDTESDAYFASRHPLSRLGAWASEQSEPIESRQALAERVAKAMRSLGVSPVALAAACAGGPDVAIPRPPHWGGSRIVATGVELWTNASGRLHDRAVWVRTEPRASWRATRIQP